MNRDVITGMDGEIYESRMDCASCAKVSLGLGFKNPPREDSYLKSATPVKLINS
jgi:hypothetical protein